MKKVARLKSLFNKGFSPFFLQSKKTLIFFKKSVDICFKVLYNNLRCQATTTQYGSLAQLAEHLTFNQGVRGSNPRWVTTCRLCTGGKASYTPLPAATGRGFHLHRAMPSPPLL